jgi:hypothetical protein
LQRKKLTICNKGEKDGAYWWMGVEFRVDQTIHRQIGFPQQCLGVHKHMGSIYQLHWGEGRDKKNEKLNLQILKNLKMAIK